MSLFDLVPPYQRHSGTSRQAAVEAAPLVAGDRERVASFLRIHGPATDEQIACALGLNPSTERPRRVKLVEDGLVAQVGEGRTSSGRRAALWGWIGDEVGSGAGG